MFAKFRSVLEEQGADLSQFPQPDPERVRMMDAVEARITTVVDVSRFVERKRTALATHASQMQESFWARFPTEAFGVLFGEEAFIRAHDTTGAPVPEADLFAGLPRGAMRGTITTRTVASDVRPIRAKSRRHRAGLRRARSRRVHPMSGCRTWKPTR